MLVVTPTDQVVVGVAPLRMYAILRRRRQRTIRWGHRSVPWSFWPQQATVPSATQSTHVIIPRRDRSKLALWWLCPAIPVASPARNGLIHPDTARVCPPQSNRDELALRWVCLPRPVRHPSRPKFYRFAQRRRGRGSSLPEVKSPSFGGLCGVFKYPGGFLRRMLWWRSPEPEPGRWPSARGSFPGWDSNGLVRWRNRRLSRPWLNR